MVITAAGDLGIIIDWGSRTRGDILQREEAGEWRDYLCDSGRVLYPFRLDELPPGRYRLTSPIGQGARHQYPESQKGPGNST